MRNREGPLSYAYVDSVAAKAAKSVSFIQQNLRHAWKCLQSAVYSAYFCHMLEYIVQYGVPSHMSST